MSLVFGDLPAAPATEPAAGVLDDVAIMRLWRQKRDTLAIAQLLLVPESAVANRLAALRDMGAR